MDRAALVELVEVKHRTKISPDDPVFLQATISEVLHAEAATRVEAAAARSEAAAERMEVFAAAAEKIAARPVITDPQVTTLLLPRLLRWWLGGGIAIQAALMAAAGLGGYVYARSTEPPQTVYAGIDSGTPRQCVSARQDGKRLCWIPVWEADTAPELDGPPAPGVSGQQAKR